MSSFGRSCCVMVFAFYCKVRMDSWLYYFKGFGSFIYDPFSLKIGLVAPKMCDYKIVSKIYVILFSLGINEGNVKLVTLKCKWR